MKRLFQVSPVLLHVCSRASSLGSGELPAGTQTEWALAAHRNGEAGADAQTLLVDCRQWSLVNSQSWLHLQREAFRMVIQGLGCSMLAITP